MGGFLTQLSEKYLDLSNKRSQLLKYVQLIYSKIINDTQYGDSLVNLIKMVNKSLNFKDPIKYKNFPISISQKIGYFEAQVAAIWRKAPEIKEQAQIIYKINHISNIVDENVIKSYGTYQNFENRFPFIPKQSTSYFNINDIDPKMIDAMCSEYLQVNRGSDSEKSLALLL